jgi:putative tryptophan/tyrosine transport system substrate-binding protein
MQFYQRRRRAFITLLGGAAASCVACCVSWPLAARAQPSERMRLVGVLASLGPDDPEEQARNAALVKGLQQLGWAQGRNLRIEHRSTSGQAGRARQYAAELVALTPDVIVAAGSAGLVPMLQATRTIPIVFTIVPDPVGAGFVDSLSRPGGNATGFSQFEYGLTAKWLELIREISPGVTRVGVLREPGLTAAIAQFAALQAVAPSLRLELVPISIREDGEIERAVATFARSAADGLIVTSGPLIAVYREAIVNAAARHKLPAVYALRLMAAAGGLMSYGPDFVDQYRLAAGYVDRILRGEKPADLPVQAPTRYELVINLKTARALGLDVPATLLARADEVIE